MTFGSIGHTIEITTNVYNVFMNMGISVPMQKQLKPWMRWKVRLPFHSRRIWLISSLDALVAPKADRSIDISSS